MNKIQKENIKTKTKYDYGTFEQDTIMELYRSKLKELKENIIYQMKMFHIF